MEGDPAAGHEPHRPLRLGAYEIVREVARGGMGVVYEAVDPTLRRRVALKVVRTAESSPSGVERLHREAGIAARLSHPNIVRIHEIGRTKDVLGDEIHYIVMDFVEGRTFEHVLRDRRMGRTERLRMLEEVARAVGYAHENGVIHRDLKPSNVLVDETGRVVLTDFGLARGGEDEVRLTRTNAVLGTPAYMAPEQVEGKSRTVGPRTDVYALGTMLYEVLVNRPPFAGHATATLYRKILREEPRRPSKVAPGVERDVETICLKALEKEPMRRYANAAEFAEDLARFRRGDPILAQPPSLLYILRKTAWRYWPGVAAAVAGSLLGAAVWAVVRSGHETSVAASRESEALARLDPIRRTLEEARAAFYLKEADMEGVRRRVEAALGELEEMGRGPGAGREVWALLGQGAWMVGDDRRAEKALLRAESMNSADEGVAYLLARLYMERSLLARIRSDKSLRSRADGEARQSMELAQRYLGRVSKGWRGAQEIDLHLAQGYRALAEEDGPELSRVCDEGFKRFGRQVGAEEYWMLLGWRQQGQDSEDTYTSALELKPQYALAYLMRGNERNAKENLEGAMADYSDAIRINPRMAFAYGNRGEMRRKARRLQEAMADFDRALELRPDIAGLWNSRGGVWGDMGDAARAEEDYSKAIEVDPRASMAWYNRARVKRARSDFKGAIEDYTKAIEVEPDYHDAYNNRSAARVQLGDLDGAMKDLEEVIRIRPKGHLGYYNRGVLRYSRGSGGLTREESARIVQDMREALRLAPASWGDASNARAILKQLAGGRDE